jgi:surface carbohydrate biosynthesis protein
LIGAFSKQQKSMSLVLQEPRLSDRLPLILPVETHVRELDGKLLLAAIAAENGRDAFVGSQNEIRARIGQLPRGHFIAKGFASQKGRFLSILQQLGFNILAWDEEGLVHPEPEIYYKRRISAKSLAYLDGVFSWGQDYTQLFRAMPFYDGTPIYETGNPRLDLLDPRVNKFFMDEADVHKGKFGKFILLNSNFGRVNSAVKRSRDKGVAGHLTDPKLDKKWQEMVSYRRELYQHFRVMFAGLCEAFPDHQVVLRPHPSERIESWHDIPEKYGNAHVVYEGNVLPWLLAAEVLVHNGCTTALESVLLGKPAISYMPISSKQHDWHLPNDVSHKVVDVADLSKTILNHFSHAARLNITPDQRAALAPFVHSNSTKLCSDEIVDVLNDLDKNWQVAPPAFRVGFAKLHATARAIEKKLRGLRPGDIYAPWHQDKHFPDFSLSEITERLARLRKATNRFAGVEVEKPYNKIFKLKRAG